MADPTKQPIDPKKDQVSDAETRELNIDELAAVTGGAQAANASNTKMLLHVRKAGGEHVEF